MPSTTSLDLDRIVAATITILENEGIDGLSMRRLATDLGTKPMSLYHYVPNKSVLLSLALSDVAARIPWQTPRGAPRDRMILIVMDMHEQLTKIPWVIAILRRGTNIGTSALRTVNDFVQAATELGLSDLVALSLWRSLWHLVAGELQYHDMLVHRSAEETSWYAKIVPTDLSDYPTVARLLPDWQKMSSAYDLRAAVITQIDGTIAAAHG